MLNEAEKSGLINRVNDLKAAIKTLTPEQAKDAIRAEHERMKRIVVDESDKLGLELALDNASTNYTLRAAEIKKQPLFSEEVARQDEQYLKEPFTEYVDILEEIINPLI